MDFVNEIGAILSDLLQTTNSTQTGGIAFIAFASCFLALFAMGDAFGFKFMTIPRAMAFFIPTALISLCLVAVVRLYVPQIPEGAASIAAQAAVPIVVSLIMLPLLAFLAKGTYVQAVIKLVVAVIASAIITSLALATWNAVVRGKAQMQKSESRTEAIDEAIGDTAE